MTLLLSRLGRGNGSQVIAVQAEGPGLGPYSLSGFCADWSAVSPMTLASQVGDKGSLKPAG